MNAREYVAINLIDTGEDGIDAQAENELSTPVPQSPVKEHDSLVRAPTLPVASGILLRKLLREFEGSQDG